MNEDVLDVFVKMFVDLGGPKLLQRGPSTTVSADDQGEEEGGADDGDDHIAKEASFRSDRRIARLMIARYWADQLISKYKAVIKDKKEKEADQRKSRGQEKDAVGGLSTHLEESTL
eukprot:CAMPEP_0198264746 /NCGR_PEP_ID=MMETSP1447-20131203/17236_1 /TAXON_ID=420782 /ORGANISM="Chaetoceros dichaeta, Strain CCMP1751" /LENGTH=115 /DNA_ID=CAMNT_0043953809 /DNA_START=1 /DNA_END=348 /DNA_ORIENTATION=+